LHSPFVWLYLFRTRLPVGRFRTLSSLRRRKLVPGMYSRRSSLSLHRQQHCSTPFRSHSDDLASVSSSVPAFQPSLSQINRARHNPRYATKYSAPAANAVVVYVNCRLVGSTSPLVPDPIRISVSPGARLSDVWTAVARGGHFEVAGVRLSGKVEQISDDFGYKPIAVLSIDDVVSSDPNDFQSFQFVLRGQGGKAEFHPRDGPGSPAVRSHDYSRLHHAWIDEETRLRRSAPLNWRYSPPIALIRFSAVPPAGRCFTLVYDPKPGSDAVYTSPCTTAPRPA
jgi:hypothetical protein